MQDEGDTIHSKSIERGIFIERFFSKICKLLFCSGNIWVDLTISYL